MWNIETYRVCSDSIASNFIVKLVRTALARQKGRLAGCTTSPRSYCSEQRLPQYRLFCVFKARVITRYESNDRITERDQALRQSMQKLYRYQFCNPTRDLLYHLPKFQDGWRYLRRVEKRWSTIIAVDRNQPDTLTKMWFEFTVCWTLTVKWVLGWLHRLHLEIATVHAIMSNDLKMRNLCNKLVPKMLTEEQKANRTFWTCSNRGLFLR